MGAARARAPRGLCARFWRASGRAARPDGRSGEGAAHRCSRDPSTRGLRARTYKFHPTPPPTRGLGRESCQPGVWGGRLCQPGVWGEKVVNPGFGAGDSVNPGIGVRNFSTRGLGCASYSTVQYLYRTVLYRCGQSYIRYSTVPATVQYEYGYRYDTVHKYLLYGAVPVPYRYRYPVCTPTPVPGKCRC